MLFNSLDFALFLPLVFIIYWALNNKKLLAQNIWLVLTSYVFYGWWDWRFLSLIFFSTFVDFLIGIQLHKTASRFKRKVLLWLSILVNLGFLGFFKYYGFFAENFISAFRIFGHDFDIESLHIILPVGISFYTFQTMSYSIDVYRKKLEPTKNVIAFAAYVSFFPQLVAGPIERATNLLPQFFKKRSFHYKSAVDGLRQILWGLFKKVVIADNCAEYANEIFNHSSEYPGSTLLLGALFFSFQIYGDFSGYSDIAIGTARLFGFNLMKNFAFPYFSRDVAEFWRRWHISLSSWFRDYVYIPLGGSHGGTWMKIRNTFVIFIISGLWHGANWTFIVWGALNAIYFLPLLLSNRNRINIDTVAKGRFFPNFSSFVSMFGTFLLITLSWIFFRATNIEHAVSYLQEIGSPSLFSVPYYAGIKHSYITGLIVLIFLIMEWLGRDHPYAIAKLTWAKPMRLAFYYAIVFAICLFAGKQQEFIYFQF